MDEFLKSLLNYWPIVVCFVGVISYLVKVAGQTAQSIIDIDKNKKDSDLALERLEFRIEAKRRDDYERMEKYYDKLEKQVSVMSADIKTLLQRGG